MSGARWRDPVNVPDLMERDKLVRRKLKIRQDAVESKTMLEHWNRTHPDESPFATTFEDAIIAWCDGDCIGPIPAAPTGEP